MSRVDPRFESPVDRAIREAVERGDFDDLPGKGKPLPGAGTTGPIDENWWIRGYLEREGVSGDALLPPALPGKDRLAEAAAALGARHPLAGFRLNAAPRTGGRVLVGGEAAMVDALPAAPSGTSAHAVLLSEGGQTWAITPYRAAGSAGAAASDGAIIAPMPGRVLAVDVAEGARVAKGDRIMTVEAMKMEQPITASRSGVVKGLNAEIGATVSAGAVLCSIED